MCVCIYESYMKMYHLTMWSYCAEAKPRERRKGSPKGLAASRSTWLASHTPGRKRCHEMIWKIKAEMIWNDMKSKTAQLPVLATRDKVHGCGHDGALPTGLLLGLRKNWSEDIDNVDDVFGVEKIDQKNRRSKSNLELVATGLIVIWQYLLRGPPTCKRQPWPHSSDWIHTDLKCCHGSCQCRRTSQAPRYVLQNVLHRHGECCHQRKCKVFSRKRGSNHGEVRGTANQQDDMLEPRLIATQALHEFSMNLVFFRHIERCKETTNMQSND